MGLELGTTASRAEASVHGAPALTNVAHDAPFNKIIRICLEDRGVAEWLKRGYSD